MWLECIKPQVQNFLMQNKIVTNIINENIQYHITAATHCITKSLQRHKFFKRRIKLIYKTCDLIFQNNSFKGLRYLHYLIKKPRRKILPGLINEKRYLESVSYCKTSPIAGEAIIIIITKFK